jgi:hypothetical protein
VIARDLAAGGAVKESSIRKPSFTAPPAAAFIACHKRDVTFITSRL